MQGGPQQDPGGLRAPCVRVSERPRARSALMLLPTVPWGIGRTGGDVASALVRLQKHALLELLFAWLSTIVMFSHKSCPVCVHAYIYW